MKSEVVILTKAYRQEDTLDLIHHYQKLGFDHITLYLNDYEPVYKTISETGFNYSITDSKYRFNDSAWRIYSDVEYQYMSKNEVRNFIYSKLKNKNNIDKCMDMFYSNRHIVIDIRNGNIVYSISK